MLLALSVLLVPQTSNAQESADQTTTSTVVLTPDQKYDKAVSLFEDGEYKEAQALLAEILFPAPLISGKDKIQKAQALLSAAYLAMGNMKSANRVVNVIIEGDVTFKFGPEYDPSLIAMAEKYRTKKEKEIAANAPAPVVEAPAFNPLRLVPFGIGHYSDGRYILGTIHLLIQAGLGASNLYFYQDLTSAHSDTMKVNDQTPCQLADVDCNERKNLIGGLAWAFYGAMALSIVDAIVFAPGPQDATPKAKIESSVGFNFGPTRDGGAQAGFSLQF